jgi:hypothetical protein
MCGVWLIAITSEFDPTLDSWVADGRQPVTNLTDW